MNNPSRQPIQLTEDAAAKWRRQYGEKEEAYMDRTRTERIKRLSYESGRNGVIPAQARFAGRAQRPHLAAGVGPRGSRGGRVDFSVPQLVGQEVHFKFFDAEAASVSVAGTFDGLQEQIIPLRKTGAGQWRLQMSLLPGRYEYHFVVDGQGRTDPLATRLVTNCCGGFNSDLVVE
jgi:hypothetical protein